MKKNWIVTLAACMVFSLSLSGCGTATNSASQTTSSESSSEAEISGKSEQDLLEEENNILEKNKDLWEKVFSSMDKNITDDMLNANYGDVLIAAIENAKDQFSDKEYEMLMSDAEQIRKIEDEMATLPIDSDNESTNTATGSSFPQFEGNDLDENKVDSSIFAENAVTVVNFWFNDCKPCVEELSEMNALNDRIKEQGGEVIGVNVGTLDGNKENIATAKQILETKGAKYRNIYFDSNSDAGKFALGVTAFPTTYVIDRNGNIVGEALLGGIDNDDNLNTLQNTIDEVLAKDAQK
ncbi:MAG: TlpA family protein disulfide reductase [Holdemanella biformis]|uniref:TlpA family protein disulfide reductase n=1 Tax=Holdemanella biformis TaxID=1735 RepID=UPI00242B0628|nr:TlpA disulfide reductase family protein [Holdemanella biformis]MBS6455467.1 TlpA family protein disulfide reductase [Holdemanella biformis]